MVNNLFRFLSATHEFISACIQKPNQTEPTWLSGNASISRSPVVHPGDGMALILRGRHINLHLTVQRVRAIGKPPEDKLCLFRNLINVVVLPSVGTSPSKLITLWPS
jgi:RNA-dependent RNA polymerase